MQNHMHQFKKMLFIQIAALNITTTNTYLIVAFNKKQQLIGYDFMKMDN